jgi:hypothetical protein
VKSLFETAWAKAMKRSRLWYLRVAFSVVTFAVLAILVVLWVRSYYKSEGITIPVILIRLQLFRGDVGFYVRPGSPLDSLNVSGIPYFVVVLLASVLPAMPWLKWSRRFSIRAMLVTLTVLALTLAALSMSLKVN